MTDRLLAFDSFNSFSGDFSCSFTLGTFLHLSILAASLCSLLVLAVMLSGRGVVALCSRWPTGPVA